MNQTSKLGNSDQSANYQVWLYQAQGDGTTIRHLNVWYTQGNKPGITRINGESFRRFLSETQGLGAAAVSLPHYLINAPSDEYVFRDLSRYMEWHEQEQALIVRQKEEWASAPYAEVVRHDEIAYMRNYDIVADTNRMLAGIAGVPYRN